MKPCAIVLFSALLLAGGCATQNHRAVVAYGELVSQHEEGDLRVTRYRVSTVERGTLPMMQIYVVFPSRLQTYPVAERAILVLSPICMPAATWYPVGEDCRRGILPDTPANRQFVAATPDERLLDNPKDLWLPRHRAEESIREYLRSQGCDLERLRVHLQRGQFGWLGSLTFDAPGGSFTVGGESHIRVTDAGEILYWHMGL